ncbi:uncharacterized protein PV06_02967 [Exophiala oligosperma]|uniref:Uncharacterized protein n=2 Tax=Chaetothyriales TaxID=34395 RepID=A0A0D2E9E0_9EURO|nr:uncharacterized protein PV06_02967 [Exophiala oligosperma]KIW44504.1 hypothetical protein PV06_02967 [Exophiala oligosperma]
MRYQHWDVLLFPGDSKIPIQEFDTRCYALEQASCLQGLDFNRSNYESMNILPTLTCFVASLERGSSFRISIHSWEKPKASSLLLRSKRAEEIVLFEANVYVDGILTASDDRHLIKAPELTLLPDTGHSRTAPGQRSLPHWVPGDPVGRIKVVIAEGVLRDTTPPKASATTFDRFRDVVSFSFQHAPQYILEYSGIAWPNMRLFARALKRSTRPPPIGSRLPPATAHESHSHSPRRMPGAVALERPSSRDTEPFQNLLNAEAFSDLKSDSVTKPSLLTATRKVSPTSSAEYEDPFLGPAGSTRHWRMRMRSSSHDIPMFDYSSNYSGAPTEMSGLSFPKANFLKHMREANPEEIVEALSPVRKERLLEVLSASQSPARGPNPPTNSPCETVHGGRAHSPIDKLTTLVASSGEASFSGDVEEEFWSKALQKRESSEGLGSRNSRGGPKDKSSKINSSSKPTPTSSETARRSSLAPLEGRSSSLRISRQRSMSNASKRKRASLSPSIKISTPGSTIHVVIDSTPASPRREKALGQIRGKPSGGEMPSHRR